MTTKAIILAAGFGSRMKEYTQNIPKPMLPLRKKPMMEYTIRQMVAHGITDIGINVHYLSDQITDYFQSGSNFGAKIHFIYEDSPTGTAGGVKKFAHFLADADRIVVIYGDIITDIKYSELLQFHQKHGNIGTVCLHQRTKSNSIVEFDSNHKITTFHERPSEEVLKSRTGQIWVNSAIYCFQPQILDDIPSGSVQDFPKDIFPGLLAKEALYAYPLNAKRYAIDSAEKYHEAENHFSDFQFDFMLP